MSTTRQIDDELLAHLCTHNGLADAGTLASVTELDEAEVLVGLERLLAFGHVEPVGVSFRVTDEGLRRVRGEAS